MSSCSVCCTFKDSAVLLPSYDSAPKEMTETVKRASWHIQHMGLKKGEENGTRKAKTLMKKKHSKKRRKEQRKKSTLDNFMVL
ncbi:Fibrocystin [Manis pentadactyla]|nr:Fibrocystin [Manis pentadactyla]